MDVLYPHCAGLDGHKKTVVACHLTRDTKGKEIFTKRTFKTMTADLLLLSDWLMARGVKQVAMESTGEYWKPVYNILEGHFHLVVANSQHVKNVPGRKTDANDAAWLAELHPHGLVRASFVPPAPQRDLRDLTRHRSNFIRERSNLIHRVHKTLESANIKLACVATDVMGVSGRAILDAIVAGQTEAVLMAELSRGRLRSKRAELEQALEGRVKRHPRFILGELLCQIEGLDETIARFDAQIEEACRPFAEAVERLDTIPGIGRVAAEATVAEIGADMSRFPSADPLASWAGVAPGNHQRGGKRLSGCIRKGNQALRKVLVQAAHAVAHTKATYLAAQYHRLAGRRGKKRAIIAVAHSILVIAYHLISRNEDYQELGANYFDLRKPEATVRRLVSRLVQLGYNVELNPQQAAVAA